MSSAGYVVRSQRVKLRAPELTGIPVHLPNPNPYPKFSSAVLSHHSVVGQSGATYNIACFLGFPVQVQCMCPRVGEPGK